MQNIRCSEVVCNLCQGRQTKHLFTVRSFNVVKCLNCGLVYLNPMPCAGDISRIYDTVEYYCNRESKQDASSGYPDYMMLTDHLAFVANELLRPVKYLKKGKLLDVGCGMGLMLDHFRKLGWDTYGIDISTYATEYARNQLGLKVYTGSVGDINLPKNCFDVVTMVLTIEHIPNPSATLKSIRRLLKPGGIVIIATHDINGLLPRIVKHRWRHIDVPEHLYFFSKDTLKRMLQQARLRTFDITETATLGSVTSSNTGVSTPVRLLRRYGLLKRVAPLLRNYHTFARILNLSDGITIYAQRA